MINVRIYGGAELDAAMSAKMAEVAAAARVFITETELELEQTAQRLARRRTGALRASITKLPVRPGAGGDAVGGVTARAPYAGYQEHGTRNMSAHAFMGPADAAVQRSSPARWQRLLARIV